VIEEVADSPALRPSCATLRVDEVMGPAIVVHEQTILRDIACLMLQQQVQDSDIVRIQPEITAGGASTHRPTARATPQRGG